jgi:xanthine dehydrogenase YagS FAD-binding subunit
VKPFAYERAGDPAGAVAAVAREPGARFLAGGTNLVDLMKLEVETPAHLVDVTHLGLDAIEPTSEGGLRIGAGVRNSELAAHPAVRERWPALAQALLAGASGQLRNLATVGGNLLQRTRCAYFQDVSKPCNKRRPGSGCPARAGDHRNLAVIGHSEGCVATHPSDMAVPLAAFGAVVHVLGPEGHERRLPMPGFHRLPGAEPDRDTVLAPGELITAVELPPLGLAARSRYRKVRDRASFAFAVTSIAAAVEVEGDTIRDCRIAFGALAHVPWRAEAAEASLRGAPADAASFAAAAKAELARAQPLRDNGFKLALAHNLLVRTLTELCEQAP